MPGDALDPVMVESRRALLDALEALAAHAERLVLVGAHAVYLHTDDIVTGVALFTKDADVALIPPLESQPDIDEAMQKASFSRGRQPGIWEHGDGQVDLLVPEALSPPGGRRAARLPGHGKLSARKVSGIDGAAVDNAYRMITALDEHDPRMIQMKVAGPGALLISKAFKLAEREDEVGQRRLFDKDAFDAYRLMRLPIPSLIDGLGRMLDAPETRSVAEAGIGHLRRLFASDEAVGTRMAGRYVEGVDDPETIRIATVALADELLNALGPDLS